MMMYDVYEVLLCLCISMVCMVCYASIANRCDHNLGMTEGFGHCSEIPIFVD